MKEYIEDELKTEIKHIFDSGANEIRILEMVKDFLNRNYYYEDQNYSKRESKIRVAAPELLEALKDCVTTINWLIDNANVYQSKLETFCNITTNSLEISNKAISKALD